MFGAFLTHMRRSLLTRCRPTSYFPRCVGAVVVSVIDQPQHYPDVGTASSSAIIGGVGGIGGGGGRGQKLLVPIVLEALPESCLSVPRKVDLGAVALNSDTSSSFVIQNLSSAPSLLR